MTDHTTQLIDFLNASPTSFQAAYKVEDELKRHGFICLDELDNWQLISGNSYYVSRNQSSVIAFRLGKKPLYETGFSLAAAHLDSPALKLKLSSERFERNNHKVTIELYGGPIVSTWLDRELSIAGRVMVKEGNQYRPALVHFKQPLAIIPNVAIHMNRDVNKGFEYNAQQHLPAILQALPLDSTQQTIRALVAQELCISEEQVGECDLFLYDITSARRMGYSNELICSGRLDDLAMSHAILSALCETIPQEQTSVAVFYDNEEIGSTTLQGANSSFLHDVLARIISISNLTTEQQIMAYRRSFMISCDMAHAIHPNFSDKHDPAYAPLINHGPAIKLNANFRYATTSIGSSLFEALCQSAEVPVQKIINRSDMPCGSTIGPIASARHSIETVDIGNPMWAMHSIRETMGVYDHEYLITALSRFFACGINQV